MFLLFFLEREIYVVLNVVSKVLHKQEQVVMVVLLQHGDDAYNMVIRLINSVLDFLEQPTDFLFVIHILNIVEHSQEQHQW